MRVTRTTATFLALAAMLFFTSCGSGGGGDERRFAFFLNLVGFPDSDTVRGHYEGWAVLDGEAVSTGKFVIVGTGPTAQVMDIRRTRAFGSADRAEFGPSITLLGERFPFVNLATHFFVTLEPEGDFDNQPSCQVLVAGAIMNGDSICTPTGVVVPPEIECGLDDGMGTVRLGLADFAGATGTFQLRTPTDDVTNATPNDFAGAWFVDDDGMGGLMAGLNLPPLSGDYRYEGWAEVDGVMRSTGTFTVPTGFDSDAFTAAQRGDDAPGPAFPGQDFVLPFMPAFAEDPPRLQLNSNLAFATGDFRAFITVEPEPDNDTAPFQLRLLQKIITPSLVNASGVGAAQEDYDPLVAFLPRPSVLISPGQFELTGLELQDLGDGTGDRRGQFELWAVVAGMPQSVGRFRVVGTQIFSLGTSSFIGDTTSVVFDAASTGNPTFPDPTMTTELFVTLEVQGDADAQPSANVVLQGFVVGSGAILSTAGDSLNGGRGIAEFNTAAGVFQLRTQSNDGAGVPPDDQFGILLRQLLISDDNEAGIGLLPLPDAWRYESWVEEIATGRVHSTGRFQIPLGADEDDMTTRSRGNTPKSGFPGKDFLFAVPTQSVAAAANGSITRVMVSVEPFPDNALEPFLVILDGAVTPGAVTGGVGGVSQSMAFVPPAIEVQFSIDDDD